MQVGEKAADLDEELWRLVGARNPNRVKKQYIAMMAWVYYYRRRAESECNFLDSSAR